jgi:hypothetical protein
MTQDAGDASMRPDREERDARERAVEAVARQQLEQDSRWRQFALDESRCHAAAYEEEASRRDSPSRLAFLRLANEPTDQFISSLEPEAPPAHRENVRALDQPLPVQPRVELAGRAKSERYAAALVPSQPFPDLDRMIAAHVAGSNPTATIRVLETVSGNEAQDVDGGDGPGRAVTSDLFVQLAPTYTASLHGQIERAVQEHASLARRGELAKAPVDILTMGQLHSAAEAGAALGKTISNWSSAREQDGGRRYHRLAQEGTDAAGLLSNGFAHEPALGEPEIDAFVGGFAPITGQHEERAQASTLLLNLDRNDGWISDDRRSSSSATNAPGQEALAAAADEVDRLRAAVRQTIDELERVRGFLHPPLPALPVNRGAYRIS